MIAETADWYDMAETTIVQRICYRHVSSRACSTVDYHTWRWIGTWIRRKHGRISWREVRRRFCDTGWRYAHNGVTFHGASSVGTVRYRCRGTRYRTRPVGLEN